MSTVQVSNITDGTNSVETVYVARGSAKAWVKFNGTGTVAISQSFNTSSLTDVGTGTYTQNLTNSMAYINFAATSGISESGVGGVARCALGDGNTVGSVYILTYNTSTLTDYGQIAVTTQGDLA